MPFACWRYFGLRGKFYDRADRGEEQPFLAGCRVGPGGLPR
jgi:hypothetical protein